jgi:hypothetical protein
MQRDHGMRAWRSRVDLEGGGTENARSWFLRCGLVLEEVFGERRVLLAQDVYVRVDTHVHVGVEWDVCTYATTLAL